jgi:hypothetical protein
MLLQNNQNIEMFYDYCLVPIFDKYQENIIYVFTLLESQANNFRELQPHKNVNYNFYSYVEPFLAKLNYFRGNVKINKKN